MRSNVIENTDIRVSHVAFGTASLHHLFSFRERQRLLHAASSVGITHFDTSPYYGHGIAESDLGAFLYRQRTEFTVTTKVGLYPRGATPPWALNLWIRKALGQLVPDLTSPVVNWSITCAQKSLCKSLTRLRTNYIDFLFLHEPDPALMKTDEFLRWIELSQENGSIRAWGIAGISELVAPFVSANHPLANVVQTHDSLEIREADFMHAYGRTLQFTYGYLSSRERAGEDTTAEDILRKALKRNSSGSVILSTRRINRIKSLANAAI